jgi:hypothetical protein
LSREGNGHRQGVRQSFSRVNFLAYVQHPGNIGACRATIANLGAVARGGNADAAGTLLLGGWWLQSSSSPQLSASFTCFTSGKRASGTLQVKRDKMQ